jgi:hypothetical protein
MEKNTLQTHIKACFDSFYIRVNQHCAQAQTDMAVRDVLISGLMKGGIKLLQSRSCNDASQKHVI